MNLRKLNRIFHRDIGYFFFGMSVIYGISGVALNHKADWNPNYDISQYAIQVDTPLVVSNINKDFLNGILQNYGEDKNYRKHYFQDSSTVRVFLKGGSMNLDLRTGKGFIETIRSRPLLREFNFLHYNSIRKLWTWFADLFALGLIVLAVTGLFMVKGKYGITGRGAWYTIAGLLIPLIFLLLYL